MSRPRVLLADDSKPLLEGVAEFLASSFDVVGFAQDGQDLIAKASSLSPDVIVVDITMPILTGIEAVHELRRNGLASPVVFLTVHNETEFLQACLLEGAKGFVSKSHMKDDLIPAITSAMNGNVFVSHSVSPAGSRQR